MLTSPPEHPFGLSPPLSPLNPNSGAHTWRASLFSEDGRKAEEILGLLAGLVFTKGSLTHVVIYSNEYLLNVQCVPGPEQALSISALKKVGIWCGRLMGKQATATRSGERFDRKKWRLWEPTGGTRWGREVWGTFQA